KSIDGFHPNRKDEFLLGRVCAAKAYEMCKGSELLNLEPNKDRSPAWPSDVVGTISHNLHWVGSAVANKEDLLGVGIDFEVRGRTRIKLSEQIRSPQDLVKHPKFSDEELLTLIFSCKESLYKALHPKVKIFFGFEDAAVREIRGNNDFEPGSFVIDLLSPLNQSFGPGTRYSFHGKFVQDENSLLTVIEVPN
ncbi:MAG: 4'-phosphopantetheinyl transferase superfamily protein, partial [Bdellovibrionales bacterium]|nr:4'-phosphopantetheinyl transferase superfamily protein [Bdellovibrionales bacterium]